MALNYKDFADDTFGFIQRNYDRGERGSDIA